MLDPTLARLIEERIPGKKYGVFYSTGEGRFFENGEEECSGSVVDEDGRHWRFWTTWSVDHGEVFRDWEAVDVDGTVLASWSADDEYQDARREAGLPATGPEGDGREGT